jgi:hypothetical protein
MKGVEESSNVDNNEDARLSPPWPIEYCLDQLGMFGKIHPPPPALDRPHLPIWSITSYA